ncbi:hypothetical protein CVT24_004474 [Panaeolus cyanescens]|uniref:Uncharacterized protein n=1 Tax=Panaeolus cyanescens TaxID=181874 RepID=A0A409V9Y7_9AGAR|nr:hypothetical protein CVT24_004474 [Panaeolus cyanescens]
MSDKASMYSFSTTSSSFSMRKISNIFRSKDDPAKQESKSTKMNLASASEFQKQAEQQGWSSSSAGKPSLGCI